MPTELAEGAKAPAFNLPRDGGGSLSLADFNGRKLVLYFYPKADTPGCTREAIEFSQLRAEYQKAGADVLGVSGRSGRGPGQVQEEARPRHPAPVRRDPQDARGLRRLGQKIHVRQDLPGNYPDHLPDRRGRADRPHLAQGQGRRPRRRGPGRGQTASTLNGRADSVAARTTPARVLHAAFVEH